MRRAVRSRSWLNIRFQERPVTTLMDNLEQIEALENDRQAAAWVEYRQLVWRSDAPEKDDASKIHSLIGELNLSLDRVRKDVNIVREAKSLGQKAEGLLQAE